MDTQKAQITDRLKQATNVLVTVSANPSVDQLAAAIGLTLLLNKLGKHATAVFSGEIPSTIEFLQPEKTLEKTADSLRDFIIALDKSKADKLRYKVEDQMVKIFITPYRTSITDKDLEYSQGDFNVEVVIALGVNEQQDLDQAITAHGRILHDATVISVSTHEGANLGGINWVEPNVSSLSEMLLDLGLSMKADVLDGQMATAFLTGIVAETNRFSNEKTSSTTMQLSAKLMAAGANQQLVASQLQPPVVEAPETPATPPEDDAELPEVAESGQAPAAEVIDKKPEVDGSLSIDHGNHKPLIDLNAEPESEEPPEEELEQIDIDKEGIIKTADQIDAMKQKIVEPLSPQDAVQDPVASRFVLQPPTMGGTLTANSTPEGLDPSTDLLGATTSPQAPLLSHDTQAADNPLNTPLPTAPSPTVEDIISATPNPPVPSPTPEPPVDLDPPPLPTLEPKPEPGQPSSTLSDLEKVVKSPHLDLDQTPEATQPSEAEQSATDVNTARDAVIDAVRGTTPQVLEPVQSLNAQPMDLNLGDMPAVTTSLASAFADPSTMVNPSPTPPVIPVEPVVVPADPSLPIGLVPPDPGLPADNTASSVTDATAPPPVPPPLIPPVMPPPEDSNSPGNAAL